MCILYRLSIKTYMLFTKLEVRTGKMLPKVSVKSILRTNNVNFSSAHTDYTFGK